jgi:hypothetical protein
MFKKQLTLLLIGLGIFSATSSAHAMCPVCTLAIGAGVGLSRWLGIDDLITGTWIGAFLMSITLWTINWLNTKKIKFIFRKPLILIFWYGTTIVPLSLMGIIGHPFNQFMGVDKLIFGIIIGTFVFIVASIIHLKLKRKNNNKSFFPLQKVAIPLILLLITSLVFYFIPK